MAQLYPDHTPPRETHSSPPRLVSATFFSRQSSLTNLPLSLGCGQQHKISKAMRAAHRYSRVPCLAVAALLMVSTCPAVRGSVEVPRRAAAAPPSKPSGRHAAAACEGTAGGHGSDRVGGEANSAPPGVDSSLSERLQARNARPGVNGSSAADSDDGGVGEGGGVGVERRSSAQQVRLAASQRGRG